jgi:hypothetical protein
MIVPRNERCVSSYAAEAGAVPAAKIPMLDDGLISRQSITRVYDKSAYGG